MSSPQVSAPPVVRGESEVRALVEGVSRAWAAGDATAFAAHYADHASAILPGVLLAGRVAIGSAMAVAFAGPLRDSVRVHRVQRVRFPDGLDGRAAVLETRSVTVLPGRPEPPAEDWSLATWLLCRQDGQWLIEAYHDCPAGTR